MSSGTPTSPIARTRPQPCSSSHTAQSRRGTKTKDRIKTVLAAASVPWRSQRSALGPNRRPAGHGLQKSEQRKTDQKDPKPSLIEIEKHGVCSGRARTVWGEHRSARRGEVQIESQG